MKTVFISSSKFFSQFSDLKNTKKHLSLKRSMWGDKWKIKTYAIISASFIKVRDLVGENVKVGDDYALCKHWKINLIHSKLPIQPTNKCTHNKSANIKYSNTFTMNILWISCKDSFPVLNFVLLGSRRICHKSISRLFYGWNCVLRNNFEQA